MELRHLGYFVAVAEELSFTGAARRLHVVQSAVSAGIKALEAELGAVLLDRTSKRVALTDAGLVLLPRARAALDAARDARDAVHEVGSGLRGHLRIGTMTSVELIDLPLLLGQFHRQHPGVTLHLLAAPSGSAGLVEQLGEGRIDLAFVSMPGELPAGVRLRELTHEPLELVVPAGDELTAGGPVPIGRLAGRSFVDFPLGYGNRTVTDRAFAAAGISRLVAIEITNIATGADYVRQGLGIALLPRFIIPADPGLVTVPVTGADLTWPMSLATSTERRPSAAASAFLRLLDAHLAGRPGPDAG
jgi:DNA-binding transcriptional LysR family regulator